MVFENHEEFWNALGRLYDSSLRHDDAITRLEHSLDELRASTEAFREGAARLAEAVKTDHDVIMKHEHRLDKADVTIEAILEDLRRHREGHSPQ